MGSPQGRAKPRIAVEEAGRSAGGTVFMVKTLQVLRTQLCCYHFRSNRHHAVGVVVTAM